MCPPYASAYHIVDGHGRLYPCQPEALFGVGVNEDEPSLGVRLHRLLINAAHLQHRGDPGAAVAQTTRLEGPPKAEVPELGRVVERHPRRRLVLHVRRRRRVCNASLLAEEERRGRHAERQARAHHQREPAESVEPRRAAPARPVRRTALVYARHDVDVIVEGDEIGEPGRGLDNVGVTSGLDEAAGGLVEGYCWGCGWGGRIRP